MSNITDISGDSFVPRTMVIQNSVDVARELLDKCESGEVKEIAIALVHQDGCVSANFTQGTSFTLLGVLTQTTNMLVDRLDE